MTDLFKEKSTDWDANEMRKKMSQAIGAAILDNVPLNDQMTVIDFGAGTGLISSQVAPFVKKITAVDVSESMLEKLMSKPDLQGKVEILCQDITAHPIGVEYDLIAPCRRHQQHGSKICRSSQTWWSYCIGRLGHRGRRFSCHAHRGSFSSGV